MTIKEIQEIIVTEFEEIKEWDEKQPESFL